jgi:hypothetical protein
MLLCLLTTLHSRSTGAVSRESNQHHQPSTDTVQYSTVLYDRLLESNDHQIFIFFLLLLMKSKYGDDDGQHPLSLYSSLSLCCHHSLEGKLFVRLIVVLDYALSLSHTFSLSRMLSLSLSRVLSLVDAASLSRGCSLSDALSLSLGCSLSLADALFSLADALSVSLAYAASLTSPPYLSILWLVVVFTLYLSRGCSLSLSLSRARMLFSLSRMLSLSRIPSLYLSCGLLSYSRSSYFLL